MKKCFLIVNFIFLILSLNCINALSDDSIVFAPQGEVCWYLENGKYGIQDINGNILSYPVFDDVSLFQNNGLAKVWIDDQCGMINKQGEFLIPLDHYVMLGSVTARFDDYTVGDGDIIQFQKETKQGIKYGCFSQDGKLITPAIWDDYILFQGNTAFVYLNNHWNIIDRNGNLLLEQQLTNISECYEYGWYTESQTTVYVDRAGNEIMTVCEFGDECGLQIRFKNKSYLFEDSDQVQYMFMDIIALHQDEGWVVVDLNKQKAPDKIWRYIKKDKGQSDHVILGDYGGECVLWSDGSTTLDQEHYDVELVTSEKTIVVRSNDTFLVLDANGKVTAEIPNGLYASEINGIIQYATKDEYGFLSLSGEFLGRISRYDWHIEDSSTYQNGYCTLYSKSDMAYAGFSDQYGQIVYSEQWEEIKEFGGGYSFVKLGETYKMIDSTGSIVSEKCWDWIKTPFKNIGNEWLAYVETGTESGYINTNTEWVLK